MPLYFQGCQNPPKPFAHCCFFNIAYEVCIYKLVINLNIFFLKSVRKFSTYFIEASSFFVPLFECTTSK